MKPYILYTRFTSRSGRRLCKALGWPGGMSPVDPTEHAALIRWGNSSDTYLDDDFRDAGRPVFNPAGPLRNIVNREHMFRVLRPSVPRHACLSVVPTIAPGQPVSGHWIIRSRFGRWGRDIVPVINEVPDGIDGDGDFLVQYWRADHEVRVHIVRGVSVSYQIKCRKTPEGTPIYDPPSHTPEFPEIVIRNAASGWHLYPLSGPRATQLGIDKALLRQAAKAIVSGSGLDFGCVDFLVRTTESPEPDSTPRRYKFLEMNTAPGLDGETLSRYVTRFKQSEEFVLFYNSTDEGQPYFDSYETPTLRLSPRPWHDQAGRRGQFDASV